MHAQKCPICEGTGKIDSTQPTDTEPRKKKCPCCKGRCIVLVPDSDNEPEKEYIPMPIYPSIPYEPIVPDNSWWEIPSTSNKFIWWNPDIICKTGTASSDSELLKDVRIL